MQIHTLNKEYEKKDRNFKNSTKCTPKKDKNTMQIKKKDTNFTNENCKGRFKKVSMSKNFTFIIKLKRFR